MTHRFTRHPSPVTRPPLTRHPVSVTMPTINLPSVLTPFADGHHTVAATGRTVGEALDDLARRYPSLAPRLRDERGAPYPFVTIYLNDEDIRLLRGFETRVEPDDDVSVVPAVAGG